MNLNSKFEIIKQICFSINLGMEFYNLQNNHHICILVHIATGLSYRYLLPDLLNSWMKFLQNWEYIFKSLPYSHEFGHILETCQRALLTAEPVIFV